MLTQSFHRSNNRSLGPRTHFGNEPTDFVHVIVKCCDCVLCTGAHIAIS
jgi:hypothetical protein